MTNHPREDGLLEWVKEQVEAAELYGRAYPEHPVICRTFEDRAAAFRVVQREIESRGPLLDVGEVRELLLGEEAAMAAWELGKSRIEDGDRDKPFPRWRGMVRAALDTFTQPEGGGDGLGAGQQREPGVDRPGNPTASADSVPTSKGGGQAGRQEDVLETVEEVGAALESQNEQVDKGGLEEESGPETSQQLGRSDIDGLLRLLRDAYDRNGGREEAHPSWLAIEEKLLKQQELAPPIGSQPPALPVEEGGE